MSPTTKESELGVSAASAQSASGPEPAGKPQPVALEIPVTVNGVRTVDGSDKREPFSETTQTVLVFGNGAVIRLASGVTPGQLLFLTNEKTKKEVVCQVVKSKNYRNVSGYVELEFTEMAVGFWGVRFPDDQVTVKPVAPRPVPAVNPASVASTTPAVKAIPVPPPGVTPSRPPVNSSMNEVPKAKPVASAPAGGSNSHDDEVEALKREAARLQEKLSSLLSSKSSDPGAAQAPSAQPPMPKLRPGEAKVLELPKASEPAPKSNSPSKYAIPALTPDPEDTVKIPSWLEPLARNAASAPVAVPAQPEPRVSAEVTGLDDVVARPPAPQPVERVAQVAMPSFGGMLLEDSGAETVATATGGSKKGPLLLAIAATLLLVVGGAWYAKKAGVFGPAATVAKTPFSEPASSASNPAADPQSRLSAATNPSPAQTAAGPLGSDAAESGRQRVLQPSAPQAVPVREVEKIPAGATSLSSTRAAHAVREEPSKPALGEVHFAAPTVNSAATEQISAGEPNLGGTSSLAGSAPSSSGLAGHAKQPAAPPPPLPVGGDVKPARLISSARPIYPSIARSQRVSGDVVVDALIDEQGHVTTMKVLSGPSLLHQAATEALRQWKYQPATLDGKPVSMHLSVTLQFRLQ